MFWVLEHPEIKSNKIFITDGCKLNHDVYDSVE